MEDMTILSREMYKAALNPGSVSEASKILKEYGQYRSLADVLRRFSKMEEPGRHIAAGLCRWYPETNPEAQSRKLRNWMSGQVRSIRKEDAFAVSRVLHLTLDDTDEFLRLAAGEGLHWRNPREIAWAYAAEHDYGFEETNALSDRIMALGETASPSLSPETDSYTEEVEYTLRPVLCGSEDELIGYLKQEWDKLGASHNMAFVVFTQLVKLLEEGYNSLAPMTEPGTAVRPGDGREQTAAPEKISTREMVETFMHRRLVPVAERGKKTSDSFTAVQKSIRESWPDEVVISKMKRRQLEVSRKVLVLLFLATDGSGSDYENLMYDEESPNRDEVFENMYMRMNVMLRSCGFPGLDPRSPFDWLVLYCMSAGDDWEIDSQMIAMLKGMFPAGQAEIQE